MVHVSQPSDAPLIKFDLSFKTPPIPFSNEKKTYYFMSNPACSVCRWKKSGRATLIRMVNPDGNMNPNFGKVDVVQDDDLNSALKFHVS